MDPVALEISQMNFFKDEDDQPMETMLAVSMLNLQLDMVAKHMKKQEIPIKKTGESEMLSCLGFNLLDPELNFFNKFLTIDSDYAIVEPAGKCESIERDVKKGFMDQLATIEGGFSKKNFKQILMQKAEQARGDM